MPVNLSFYVKPTNYCTVGCDHCFIPPEKRAVREQMTLSEFEGVLVRMRELAESSGALSLQIIWHGGEPMMVPLSWYEDAQVLIEEELRDFRVMQCMQTSLMPATEKWVPFIKTYLGGVIGASYDFTSRSIKGDVLKFRERWVEKVKMLQDNSVNLTVRTCATLVDMDNNSYMDDLFNFYLENDIHNINFDRYIKTVHQQDALYPSNKKHAQFLIRFFDENMSRLARGLPFFRSNVVTAGLAVATEKRASDTWGSLCASDSLVIEPNGDFSSCPTKATKDAPFGHYQKSSFAESEARKDWIIATDFERTNFNCLACEFYAGCKSGCPLSTHEPDECNGYRSYLMHVKNFSEHNPGLVEAYRKSL